MTFFFFLSFLHKKKKQQFDFLYTSLKASGEQSAAERKGLRFRVEHLEEQNRRLLVQKSQVEPSFRSCHVFVRGKDAFKEEHVNSETTLAGLTDDLQRRVSL